MAKILYGTVAGAVVLVSLAALFLLPLFLAIGPERVFKGATLEFNTFWTGMAMVASLMAATAAGWTAHRVSGRLAAVITLAAAVFLFGMADAALHHWWMPQLSLGGDGAGLLDLLIGLREPLWYDLSGPVLMAIFIWIAGSSRHIETTAPRKDKPRA